MSKEKIYHLFDYCWRVLIESRDGGQSHAVSYGVTPQKALLAAIPDITEADIERAIADYESAHIEGQPHLSFVPRHGGKDSQFRLEFGPFRV